MTTQSHSDQIAVEAVEKLHSKSCRTREDEKAIIKSAVEKGYCLGVDEMTKAGVEAFTESRAAHASEGKPDFGPAHKTGVRYNSVKELREAQAAHASEPRCLVCDTELDCPQCRSQRPAHASEQWTLQKLAPYMGLKDNYKALLDAINNRAACARDEDEFLTSENR